MTHNKQKIALILIITITLIAGIIYILTPKSYIKLALAPQQAFMKIDGGDQRGVSNGDKIRLNPGRHTIVFYRDEFKSHTESIELKNGETIDLTVALLGLTDSARTILNNGESDEVIEKFTAVNMDKDVKKMQDDYPILKILPLDRPTYRMYSCKSQKYPSDTSKIAVCINVDDTGFVIVAYDDAKALGYDLNEYEVIIN